MRVTSTTLSIAVTLSLASTAHAGGFQVSPTASATARLMAGNGILGEEIGDMFYNPAALSMKPYDNALQLGLSVVNLGNDFVDEGSARIVGSGAAASTLPLQGIGNASSDTGTPLGIFYADKLPWNDKINYGIGLTTPFGMSTTYEPEWIGRYHSVATELRIVDLNFAASMAVSPTLLIGGGFSLQSTEATLIQAAPASLTEDQRVEIEGSDSALGFNAGAIFTPSESLTLGLSYRSRTKQDIEGHRHDSFAGATTETPALAPLTLPESWYFSVHYHPASQPWSIAVGTRFTAWHRFDELRVDYEGQLPATVLPQDWNDILTSGISVDYKLTQNLKGIVSIGYDEGPAPNAVRRSAQVPSFDRKLLGLGLEFQNMTSVCSSCSFYFAFQRTFTSDRAIDNLNQLSPGFAALLNGHYEGGHFDIFSGHLMVSF